LRKFRNLFARKPAKAGLALAAVVAAAAGAQSMPGMRVVTVAHSVAGGEISPGGQDPGALDLSPGVETCAVPTVTWVCGGRWPID
jgi:hypothetical protein